MRDELASTKSHGYHSKCSCAPDCIFTATMRHSVFLFFFAIISLAVCACAKIGSCGSSMKGKEWVSYIALPA
eukprot:778738-Pelagomonas_calceolata.AAC.7